MKKRTHKKSASGMSRVGVFILLSLGCISFFIFSLLFQTNPSPEVHPQNVLGASNKQVKEIMIQGKKWDYKNDYIEIDLPGLDGESNFFPVPVTISYEDGSSKTIHLGFQYLQ